MKHWLIPPEMRRLIAPHLCSSDDEQYTTDQGLENRVYKGWYFVNPESVPYITSIFLLAGYQQDDDGDFISGHPSYGLIFMPERGDIQLFEID